MKNRLLKLTALSLIASGAIYAGGYKIPENSVNSTSLLAANIAHSSGADSAYFNPANMAFMSDENSIDISLMLVGKEASNFKGSAYGMSGVDIDSESESPLIPAINFVSNKYGDFNFGFSMVVPSGVTKRWNDSPAKAVAEQFTLEVIELNPTVSYKLNDQLAVAVGARVLYSSGIVKGSSTASRDMEGNSLNFGYNLALAYKPTDALELALTYRSKVELTEEGNAKLYIGDAKVYDGGSSVEVPLPATLSLAAAYTFETKTTLEVVYERNFWSAYETLDFNYESKIPAILQVMDTPIVKDWEDTTTIRVGVTQEFDKLKLMAGLAIDENPVPEQSINFELPGVDSTYVSFGTDYKINEKFSAGFGLLYSIKDALKVNNVNIQGTFDGGTVYIISTGIGYKF